MQSYYFPPKRSVAISVIRLFDDRLNLAVQNTDGYTPNIGYLFDNVSNILSLQA